DVILKRQEYQKINSEGLQKLVSLAEQIYKKAGMALLGLLIGFASVELVLGLTKIIFQAKSATKLGNKIAAIKLTNSEESSRPLMIQSAPGPAPSGGGHRKDSEPSYAAEKNSLELMSAISLRALLSDAYWCERDRYAAWVWSCLSPLKKIELLESWGPFESYVGYLSRIEPEEDRFHLDPAYLKPQPCHKVSNKDIMNVLKTNKAVWLSLSQMRRQNLPLALRERIDFSKWTPTENQGAQVSKLWGTLNSPLRALPAQLGINSLTEQDELVLMENPEIVTGSLRRQLPSLVWVALLPKPEREKLLQKIPAQSLAEVWVGPQKALQLILEVLPEKKRELLHDYAKKIEPMRESPLVLSLSNSAHDIFERSPLAKSPEIIERKVA
ncbi:MAG: hypothetical protein ACXWRA_16380, partial [Pseudobdellovibrionaceae bacterium]